MVVTIEMKRNDKIIIFIAAQFLFVCLTSIYCLWWNKLFELLTRNFDG